MNRDVDAYIDASEQWPEEMRAVRSILLDAGLDEQIKWRKPCFADGGRNIAILQEMKGVLALMFFKGALLDDPDGLLVEQGPNSRSAKRLEFTSVAEVNERADGIRALVVAAIEVEDSGLAVEPAPPEPLAAELRARLDADPALAEAFGALTPGRRREYNLHICGAKQSATRAGRVEKMVPRILAGKGMRDR